MLPPHIRREFAALVAHVQTEGEALQYKREFESARESWRETFPGWRSDPRGSGVDEAFGIVLDQLDELIECHGQC